MRALISLLTAFAIAQAQNGQERLGDVHHGQHELTTPCDFLSATFRGQVVMQQDPRYSHSQQMYWSSQQAELSPSCRWYPKNSRDIVEALADIFIPMNVSIAVESGGHSSVPGASNVDGGITIDLHKMNKICVTQNLDAVFVGPGARWKDVYFALEAHNLTVPGSRVANVGVGGFVLGGGLSWFANEHGWTCDAALEFEVVTPLAEALWSSTHKNDDLFWALRGSSGAFGIVTQIKLPTIHSKQVYGGAYSYNHKYTPQLFRALENLATHANDDPSTQGYLSFGWIAAQNRFTYSAYLLNTEGKATSSSLAAFDNIPHYAHSLRTMTVGESADEIDASNPLPFRRDKFTLSCKASTAAMLALHELIETHVHKLKFRRNDLLGVTFQPLTVPHMLAQNNFFNLSPKNGPLLLVSVEFSWEHSTMDGQFISAAKDLRHRLEKKMRDMNALEPFIYPNYAARDQDPFKTLSPANRRVLETIKRKHDPYNVWRKLVPGIWHI